MLVDGAQDDEVEVAQPVRDVGAVRGVLEAKVIGLTKGGSLAREFHELLEQLDADDFRVRHESRQHEARGSATAAEIKDALIPERLVLDVAEDGEPDIP